MSRNSETFSSVADHPVGLRTRRGGTARPIPRVVMTILVLSIVVGAGLIAFAPLSKMAVGGIAMVLMLALIFSGMPVAFAMGLPALLAIFAIRGTTPVVTMFSDIPYTSIAQWTLSVIPMFILMGLLMWRAGLTEALYVAARRWSGFLPGGLAVSTNLAGAGLAAVSGSTIGTTFALAKVGVPEMLKRGYDKRLAIASVMAAGMPGQLIPPSIMLVLYAGIAGVAVGPQLLAGIVPGVVVALIFGVMLILIALRAGMKRTSSADADGDEERVGLFSSLVRIWPVPVLILVIIVGMLSGIFTATEAGAVAAFIALLITLWWRRKDGAFKAVSSAAVASVTSVGTIFMMLVGVTLLSRMLSLTGISRAFADWITDAGLSRIGFLFVLAGVYLVLGMIMDPLPMMLLTVPVLLPTLSSMDISLVWFGVFVVFAGEMAVLTPPVGMLLYIVYGICQDPEVNLGQEITMMDVIRALLWIFPAALAFIVLLIFVPELATFIPDLAG